jgi:DNA gyrase subunit A
MDIGHTRQINIEQEMRDAFLDYAMSVIISRALPDARDGLKPVHRRILYAMHDMGIRSDTAFKKCARIVGEVLGKYHPHGDSAVYESLVRMAQDFSMRYMLVDGQGNFGSIDGDGAAAMRYTEARMAQVGEELMGDIEKNTVDFTDNFDGSLQEPMVLPAAIPNLLVNGVTGIAVGMSTNIPPHNLAEVCDALTYILSKWEDFSDITINELMQFVKGPDFPTGGLIYRHEDGADDSDEDNTLVSAYATGRGKVIIRAKAFIEDMGRGKQRIIVSELPYQVNKTSLIERIASLVREGRLEGLSDLRDESDRQGLRLVIELQRGVDAAEVLAKMYKLTQLQETFGIIMLALVNNEPRVLSLKQALKVYLDHRLEIVRRRSEFDLQKARARAHILLGLLKAIDAIDAVIRTIRQAEDTDTAKTGLMSLLEIDEIQAQAILDMQLRRLAALERMKIQEEYDEKIRLIAYLEDLLATPTKMRDVITAELRDIRAAYGDKRRSKIIDSTASTTINVEDLLMPEEPALITMSSNGKLARMHNHELPRITVETKEPPRFIIEGTANETLYLFTAKGMCATLPVQQLPEADTPADGTPFNDLTPLTGGDEVVAVHCMPPGMEHGYLFLASETGQVKRVRLADIPGNVSKPFMVMNVGEDDRVIWVMPTDGRQEVVLTTNNAQAIRFHENTVRPTGLPAGGMRGIKLGMNARVVGADIAADDRLILSVSDDAVAKVSVGSDYPVQGRAGGGVIAMRLAKSSKEIAATASITPDQTVWLLSNRGKAKELNAKRFPVVIRGRPGGDIFMTMERKDEQIAAVVVVQPRFTPFEPVSEGELAVIAAATEGE